MTMIRLRRHLSLLLVTTVALNVCFFVINQSKSCDDKLTTEWLTSPTTSEKTHEYITAVSSFEYRIVPIPCRSVPQVFHSLENFWDINELRRNISMTDPQCFQTHRELFVPQFLERLHIRQYNLHIPKTGGTSLCKLVRDNKLKAPPKLCRHKAYCPFWCNFCTTRKYLTCDGIRESKYKFVGNERWMDYEDDKNELVWCSDYAYSISIREPVARALSNVNMWFETCYGKRNFTPAQRTERLNIVQSNYLVWSLASGISENPEAFRAKAEHVPLAKRALAKFDFVIEVSNPDICNEDMYQFMGFRKTEISHARVAAPNYTDAYHKESYKLLNALDTEVYQFAQEIMKADCQFYAFVKEKYEIPKLSPLSPRNNTHNRPLSNLEGVTPFRTNNNDNTASSRASRFRQSLMDRKRNRKSSG